MNDSVRNILDSSRKEHELKTRSLSTLMRFFLKHSPPPHKALYYTSPYTIIHIHTFHHPDSAISQPSLEKIDGLKETAAGYVKLSVLLSAMGAIVIKRFFRSRNRLIALTSKGGAVSSLGIGTAILGGVTSFMWEKMYRPVGRELEGVYLGVGISEEESENDYRRFLSQLG